MCSKKWAKPDLPGSTSLREPVCTGIVTDTRFGKPVGTTITFRPLARVFSVALKGRTSLPAALFATGLAGAACAGSVHTGADSASSAIGKSFDTGSPWEKSGTKHKIFPRE